MTVPNKISVVTLVSFLASSVAAVDVQSSRLPVTTVEDFDLTQYASAPWYVQQQAENTYTPPERNRCVTAQYKLRDDNNEKNWWDISTWWGYTVDVFNYAEDDDGGNNGGESSTSVAGGNLCADFDPGMPSQLKVAPCFLPKLFAGPYWVVSYREGETDGYALVSGGQPTKLVEGEESECGATGTSKNTNANKNTNKNKNTTRGDNAGVGGSPCCKTGESINNSGLWIFTRKPNPSDALVKEVRSIAKQKGFSTTALFNVTHDEDCNVPGV